MNWFKNGVDQDFFFCVIIPHGKQSGYSPNKTWSQDPQAPWLKDPLGSPLINLKCPPTFAIVLKFAMAPMLICQPCSAQLYFLVKVLLKEL